MCGIKSAKKHKKHSVEESVLYDEVLFLAKLVSMDFVITPDQDLREAKNSHTSVKYFIFSDG
jgi:hypothetical protein